MMNYCTLAWLLLKQKAGLVTKGTVCVGSAIALSFATTSQAFASGFAETFANYFSFLNKKCSGFRKIIKNWAIARNLLR
ncbi:MAG: hypothetical protein SAJ12_00975 [Jaaginema sp. PMC 1079.18]|nr:hypothetical protein [Jaaginema sp. PMC 1080.18]MEC4849557.1 hypothetical protein [Jaaginema sp. PMC 1079.18]